MGSLSLRHISYQLYSIHFNWIEWSWKGRIPEVIPIEGTQQGQTTTLGTLCPTLFEQCVGSFTSGRITYEQWRVARWGIRFIVFRPRRLESLTICRCNITKHNHVASLTYVCFILGKGLIRDLSANSSNIAFWSPVSIKMMVAIWLYITYGFPIA